MSSALNSAFASLQTAFDAVRGPAGALAANLSAIVANRPEPARNVAVSALVAMFLAWAVLKLATRKKAPK